MIRYLTYLMEAIAVLLVFRLSRRQMWGRFEKGTWLIQIGFMILSVFLSFSCENIFPAPMQTVTVVAKNEKNERSGDVQVYLEDVRVDGVSQGVPAPSSGEWVWYNKLYCWFKEGDERCTDSMTQQITFELPVSEDVQLVFLSNPWKGLVSVGSGRTTETIDTYQDSENNEHVTYQLPKPGNAQIFRAAFAKAAGFSLALLLLYMCDVLLAVLVSMLWVRVLSRLRAWGPAAKLLRHQFLLEVLIDRDFKKKYKRTVLGILWSVLSPLLTLFIMRIVFTRFFGRSMAHYTTYLFCGNLVFSYFNESTSQGMTSLLDNAGIFSKVNIPKYMFLLSKNIQTLINFGLTLCVFVAFCVMDRITFTWKFVLLLYPICCLVLFNIGVGLVLSALFVFFRDIQYLWSVFTQLLMYLSAIFYTIDSYSEQVQCAFLLNPVYLFIRYFRKIVIESVIPTPWFHLLMAADVFAVLAIGSWMYKKYNTRFLYYV